MGESPAAGQVADVQESLYRPVLAWLRDSPFRTGVLGHSIHPMLTDVTLGCWLSASILDAVRGRHGRGSALVLVGSGLVASVPTAFAGAADWATLSGEERRIGAIHSLGTDVATFLFVGSLVARLRRKDATGVRLAVAGNAVLVGAGFLGGHLALSRGTAKR